MQYNPYFDLKRLLDKIHKLFKLVRDDKKPLHRLLYIILKTLPFDLGKSLKMTIKVQDYIIYLNKSSLSLGFFYNPNDRQTDYSFITSYLKKNDIYYDIGANIGTTIIPAAISVGEQGKVIGIEPHPKIFSYLIRNISLNNLNNVELYNFAVGNERKYIKLSDENYDDTNSILIEGDGIGVKMLLLDDFTNNYTIINLLEIDVEGYEKYVVEGGRHTLNKSECIYFELCDEHFSYYGYSVKYLLTMLEDMGFYLFIRNGLKSIKQIDRYYLSTMHHSNAFGLKDISNFLRRTGWRIDESGS
jgi:FkbM family methyltransferase